MVLDAGRIAEYDTPRALLGDPASAFSGIVREMGDEVLQRLTAIVMA